LFFLLVGLAQLTTYICCKYTYYHGCRGSYCNCKYFAKENNSIFFW